MTTASHLAEDRNWWKLSGLKHNEDHAKELWEWGWMKIAAKASKWTQSGEGPSGPYATLVNPTHWILGNSECFSVFCSQKKFHNVACNFTTHIPLVSSLKSKRRIQIVFSKEAIIILTAVCNSIVQGRRVLWIYKNGVHTTVILEVIVNVEGLWVRNPFRIQSERRILSNRPWRLPRTHLKLL